MAKRSYSGDAASPHQPEPGDRASARCLASYARAYANGRATAAEVRAAFEEFEREADAARRLGIKPEEPAS